MPPHEQEPQWPSDDSDTSGAGDKAAQPPAPEGEKTAQLPVQPRLPEAPTVWVQLPQPLQSSRPTDRQAQQADHRPSPPSPPSPASPAARQAKPPQSPSQPQQSQQPQPWPPWPAPQPLPAQPVPSASAATAQPVRIEPTGEAPAAAQAGDEEPVPPKRGKRRVLVFSGVAVLLVVALGVAAALPYVSNRLGLPWAPNLPKGDSPEPTTVNLALKGPSPSAPTPTNVGVSAALSGPASNPALGTLTGTVIDPATGSTLWDRNSGQPLTPASTTKLLTTSAALLALDHGLQLGTKVVAGSSPDTVILVPGGDATLSALPAGQKSIYTGAAHLDDLVAQVKREAGGSVKKVQIDPSLYSGGPAAASWEPEDVPKYAAQIVPGMLDGGLIDPHNEKAEDHVNDPSGALLKEFADRLGAATGGTTAAPKGAKVLGEVRSAPITELIDNLLQLSDNTLAEVVGRQTAIAAGAAPTFDGVAQTTLKVLSQNGFDTAGVVLHDGSGLSNLNRVPARLLAQLLAAASAPDGKDPRTAKLRPLLEGLPVAGGSGTLSDRYRDPASSPGKGWVRAKTGTLTGVNNLAGVVLDADGRMLAFALMSNGSDQNVGRSGVDAVAATLRGCGCR